METTTSIPSNCCSTSQVQAVVSGVLVVVGVVALLWLLLPRQSHREDPLTEAERRIEEIEKDLLRLQQNVGQTLPQ